MTYGRDVRSDNWEVEGIGVAPPGLESVFFFVVISAKAKKGDSSVRPVELFMVSVVKRDLDCT